MNASVFDLGPDFKIHTSETFVVVHHVESDAMVLVPRREIVLRLGYLDLLRRRDRPADVLRHFVRRVLDDYRAGKLPRTS